MKANNEEVIDQLNILVEINNDRIEGYERALHDTTDQGLKDLFRELAGHSRKNKDALSAEVTRLGGEPTTKTRNTGKIFRAWMDLKAALTGKDKKAVMKACEFGEDSALEVYENVLKDHNVLSTEQREMVVQQRSDLMRDHERVKSLRDAVKS